MSSKAEAEAVWVDGLLFHQGRWITDALWAKREAKACEDNFKLSKNKNFAAVIKSVWGGDAGWGLAIACHELRGTLAGGSGLVDSKMAKDGKVLANDAVCGFQIDRASGYKEYANRLGIPLDKFVETLNADPYACARAGYEIFKDKAKVRGVNGSKIGMLCAYAGGTHLRHFWEKGTCGAYIEFGAVKARLEGVDFDVNIQADINKPCYGCGEATIPEVGTIYFLNCHDYSVEFAAAIAKAAKAFRAALITEGEEVRQDSIEASVTNKTDYSHIEDSYCLKAQYSQFFETLLTLLNGIDQFIYKIVRTLLEEAMQKVCEYVASAISSVLKSICLPLPNLDTSFGLGSLSTKSCEGISLNDLINFSSGAPKLDIWASDGKLKAVEAPVTPLVSPEVYIRAMILKAPKESIQF